MIRIIPAIPRDPVARFRLLSLWFALFTTVGTVIDLAVVSAVPAPARYVGVAACLALSAWFIWGYRRRRFPEFTLPAEAVLLVAIGASSSMPLRAMGVFFAACQLRALYVTKREFILLPVSFGAARALSIVFAQAPSAYPALSLTVALQVIGLIIISTTLFLLVTAIDRQSQTERALHRSEERYRLLASATHDMVYEWHVATGAVEHGDALRDVFGFADAEVVQDRAWWLDRIHPDDRASYDAAQSALLGGAAGIASGIRYRIRRADGRDATVVERAVIRRDTDDTLHVIGSVRDVTAEHRLEEQLRQAQKMEAIGQLAGGAAHDFNNLLTVIGGHVFMLEEHGGLDAEALRHLDGITRAADRAGSLTRQLLAFGRRQVLKASVVDLNAVVTDVVRLVGPLVGERVNVATHLAAELPPVMADPGQLEQVLLNLAINARDAMPAGGTLTITTASAIEGEHRMVRVALSDTGTGMDAETMAHLFEPFYTTKSPGKGTGLGLATAYGIIKQSFGDITVESSPGNGSTFTITLPVTAVAATTKSAPPPVAEYKPGSRGAGKRVLLVEDDDDVREFAREVLTRSGYQVFPARNGVNGLAVAEAQGHAFDLVVTDVVMPEMGGRQMVTELRRVRPTLPVLYISGYADDPEARRELGAGADALLEKPFTARTLRDAVGGVAATAMA